MICCSVCLFFDDALCAVSLCSNSNACQKYVFWFNGKKHLGNLTNTWKRTHARARTKHITKCQKSNEKQLAEINSVWTKSIYHRHSFAIVLKSLCSLFFQSLNFIIFCTYSALQPTPYDFNMSMCAVRLLLIFLILCRLLCQTLWIFATLQLTHRNDSHKSTNKVCGCTLFSLIWFDLFSGVYANFLEFLSRSSESDCFPSFARSFRSICFLHFNSICIHSVVLGFRMIKTTLKRSQKW